ncbi:YceI family protein [bacterium]|mgnify:FL=1|jgi:polyisoprenoid-binding protein YceI|nr:YceI family protein [bacterium]MBT4250884.1 YceI family protein [bacterium]MBT4597597.1 YceI family protein [bacterium]MBT6754062.1 YceI family protein [bacterium]MBT7038092.1 YceI family protein [bacterium]
MNKNIILLALLVIVIVLAGYWSVNRNNSNRSTKREITDSQKILPKQTAEGLRLEIDPVKSIIRWEAKKTLVTTNNHNGTVDLRNGFVMTEKGVLVGGEFVINMNSIISLDLEGDSKKKLETHLISTDFFDVDNFPETQLTIKEVTPLENSNFSIIADLTIKGITNEITFDATLHSVNDKLLLKTKLEIDRTLWNVRFGSGKFFDNLGDNLIDDQIKFSVELMTVERKRN